MGPENLVSATAMNVRWLGKVAYREALAIQQALFSNSTRQFLLLLEHPHVFTYGLTADLATNLKCDPNLVGAELVKVNRGGDITYHGPGQLVAYPIINLPAKHGGGGPSDSKSYVFEIEQVVIDTLNDLGVMNAGRLCGYPGVWIDPQSDLPKKICAIGVRVSRQRTMHGLALNVSTDLSYMRQHIVPCGIDEFPVTSLAELGIDVGVTHVANIVAKHVANRWSNGETNRQDVTTQIELGVAEVLPLKLAKPDWLRPHVKIDSKVLATKKTLNDMKLSTVCQEAGCPNLSECWADGTATIMVLGERCTRACGFCLIDTRKPLPPDSSEPLRVAQAVHAMNLEHAVLTMVARDDLADSGMTHVAQCVAEIRKLCPRTSVETLISDAKGSDALEILLAERPDILNHNIETVARLQRKVRPSASYARSLGVLARARGAGLVTKSGFMLGLGERQDEVEATLIDLASVGVQIVTIGQYLQPSSQHLPVARWATPQEFESYAKFGESLGIKHVEASPLTRSSYHAKRAAQTVKQEVSVELVSLR